MKIQKMSKNLNFCCLWRNSLLKMSENKILTIKKKIAEIKIGVVCEGII